MALDRPYRRTCRQLADGSYANSGNGRYVKDPRYAIEPHMYVRAFLVLQKDFQELIDFIEPADTNLNTYSYRVHELLVRASIEVEANLKAILTENGYSHRDELKMTDYKKVEQSHKLSSYAVKVPYWRGVKGVRRPFATWSDGKALPWYTAYNTTKHDRHQRFEDATFEQALDAICGLLALLSAQFLNEDFSPTNGVIGLENEDPENFEDAIGAFFRVQFPDNWPPDQRYSFDWEKLRRENDAFAKFPYA